MDLPYFFNLIQFLNEQKTLSKVVFPPDKFIFNAFNVTPFEKIKVVILGQDPYHGYGQAHGLSFSVPHGINSPPSLKNIFKELKADLNIEIPNNGNLTKWANQGVFLLNSFLTVESNLPASHQSIGWEQFTDFCISAISKQKENVVFLLWGKFAQEKSKLIDSSKHLVLLAPHPSPFSAHTGFIGCKHFSKTNDYLISKKIEPIDWQIKDEGLFG
jgi:uracil-DNA glycosylase